MSSYETLTDLQPARYDANGSRAAVLLIDGMVEDYALIQEMFRRLGQNVRVASNAERALAAVRATAPDLILLDINSPGFDCFEVCRKLKMEPGLAQVPVIFMSFLPSNFDRVKAFEAGGADFLTKPFQFTEFVERVGVHLRKDPSYAELIKKNQRLRAFNRIVIHDLRTSLSGVLGYLELSRMNSADINDETHRHNVDCAIAVGTQMREMIQSLVDVDRLEHGQLSIRQSDCALDDLVNSALEQVDILFGPRRVQVEMPAQPVRLECDADVIQRVIVNLLYNAIQCTRSDGKIDVRLEASHTKASLEIMDDGPEIPLSYQEKIFETFGPADLRNRGHAALPGVGVPFCRRGVEVHGGRMGLRKAEPRGNVFWMELPRTGRAH